MNSEIQELRYTPLPDTIPVGSPYRLNRAPNVIRGANLHKVDAAFFTSGNRSYEAELFRLLEPFTSGERQDHTLLFGPEAKGGEMFWLWSSLAYAAMTAGEKDGVSWQIHPATNRLTPVLSRSFLETRLKQFLQPAGNQTEDQFDESKINKLIAICDRGIERSDWPISKNGKDYMFSGGPDMVFYLAASNYLTNHGFSGDIESLRKEGLLAEEKFFHYGPFFSFLAENIFDYENAEFQKFILGLSDNIGGDLGLTMAVWEINFLRRRTDNEGKELLLRRDQQILLRNLEAGLQEKYLYQRYIERPAVVSPDTLFDAEKAAIDDPSLFWQVIFEREGVKKAMEDLFGGNADLLSGYETALRERKVIPASLMMIAGAMGSKRREAQILGALSQFGWGGVIVPYDNVVDGHKIRKGYPTQVAIDGVSIALDTTMLSLANVLSNTLHDRELEEKFLEMLKVSCTGDRDSRRLGWDDSVDRYLENMAGLVKAFSWFPEYIGKRMGLVESGQNFTAFLAELHTLGQLNNDIEDINPPPEKHEEGNDIGQRITLFWKILMDLPSNLVSEDEKMMIRRVFAFRNGSQQATQDEIEKVLVVGKRCKEEVLAGLKPIAEKIYTQADRHLNLAFDCLPVMDERNKKYQMIFSNILETIR